MKGLELAEQYYEQCGRPMLEERFPDVSGQMAIGLVGQGSECLGFDDVISRDHDYGPSFCVWLPRAVYADCGAAIQEAYDNLPREFMGFSGRVEEEYGKGRVGVLCMEDFYEGILGRSTVPETERDWLILDEHALATATNGKVFVDHLGKFTEIRQGLLSYYPREVWIRRVVHCLAKAAQAGQYNYARAMKRGERITAELSLTEFIREVMQLVYLLNRKYAPYDKWMRRGMKELSVCAEVGDMLDLLYQVQDSDAAWENVSPEDYVYHLNTNDGRVLIIEAVCNVIVQELNAQGLSDLQDNFLQNHLQAVLNSGQNNT